jgi:hypothetical protein
MMNLITTLDDERLNRPCDRLEEVFRDSLRAALGERDRYGESLAKYFDAMSLRTAERDAALLRVKYLECQKKALQQVNEELEAACKRPPPEQTTWGIELNKRAEEAERKLCAAREAMASFADEGREWAKDIPDDYKPMIAHDSDIRCADCDGEVEGFEEAKFTVGDLRRAAKEGR